MSSVLWAGFAATVLTACWYSLVRAIGWTEYSPSLQLGRLVLGGARGPVTDTAGVLLFLVLGSTLFAALYVAAFGRMGGASWSNGAVLGMLHGFVFLAALPLLGAPQPRTAPGRPRHATRWGLAWGKATPWLIVAGHVCYGTVLGAVFAGF